MPTNHQRSFRIRACECDANGHLHSSNYLRFMQETAFDALTEAGYDLENHQDLLHQWLVHESYLRFRKPIYYNDRIVVNTWLSDIRKFSTRRNYLFSQQDNHPSSNKLDMMKVIADGWSDWVYIDAETKKLARIPLEYAHVFFPEGVPDKSLSRNLLHFPSSSLPQEPYSTRYRVTFDDLDVMQHVNNARYMDLVNLCGFKAIENYGWSWQRLIEHGFAIFLYDFHIKYVKPAILGDELEIITWLANVKHSTANRHFIVNRVHDDTTIVRVKIKSVWIDTQTNRAIRIPEEIMRDFSPNISR